MIGKLLKKIFSNGNEKVKEISRLDGMSSIKESVVCEECGHSIPLKKGGTFDKCPQCGHIRMKTFRELGLNIDELPSVVKEPKNTHEMRALIKYKTPLRDYINIDYSSVDEKTQYEMNSFLDKCAEIEKKFMNTCSVPWSTSSFEKPYERIAILARKTRNYALEVEICKRYIEIIKEVEEIYTKSNVYGRPGTCGIRKKMDERVIRAQELLEKQKNKPQNKPSPRPKTSKINIDRSFFTLTLQEQCSLLGIHFSKISLKWDDNSKKYDFDKVLQIKKVEEAVMHTLRKKGFQGTFYELHPLMQIMQAGCLPYLEESSKNLFEENYRARTFSAQIGMYGLDKEKLANLINTCSRDILLEKWKEIYADSTVQKWFPGITVEDINALITAIPQKTFSKILDAVLKDPINNSVGWPDIFAYDGEKLRLIEVKTTDKLRESQKYTYINIIKKIGLPVEVIQVIKK